MTDNPKTWGEMTDAEKGALLLAHHEGKVIEYHNFYGKWKTCFSGACVPFRDSGTAYRVRPEPKRETVTMFGADFGKGKTIRWAYSMSGHIGPDTHRITFQTIDGEPDCNSIRMERIDD